MLPMSSENAHIVHAIRIEVSESEICTANYANETGRYEPQAQMARDFEKFANELAFLRGTNYSLSSGTIVAGALGSMSPVLLVVERRKRPRFWGELRSLCTSRKVTVLPLSLAGFER